jgi:alkylresorcinol/alkylpyrone synthase
MKVSNNEPKIISLGVAAPAFRYTQQEIFEALEYPHAFSRMFRDAQIQHRQFCVPTGTLMTLSFQEQQDIYKREATNLAREAIINALDGRPVVDIGALVFCSCTGFAPGPTIAHYLARDMKMRPDISLTNINAMGCESGGYPGLKRAIDFTKASGQAAIVVSCELCSLTYCPEDSFPNKIDPEGDYELARAASLFGDYSSAAIVGFDANSNHPVVIDAESYTNTDYLEDLGYQWRNGRLRVRLSKRVPELATDVSTRAVKTVLARNGLYASDITWWVIHAAGIKVLEMIAAELGLPDEKLTYSKRFLRTNGNCSSATVGGIAKMLIQSEKPAKGDYLAVVSVGPGMTGGCHLLRFG